MRECYVRGNCIKYLRIPDEVIEKVKEEDAFGKCRPTHPPNPRKK